MPAAWETTGTHVVNGNEVAVLIPHTGEVTIAWMDRFHNIEFPEGTNIFYARGTPIDISREQLVDRAIDTGAKWFFFLDTDVLPPKDVFKTLVSYNEPIMSGLYTSKLMFEGKPQYAAWGDLHDGKGGFTAADTFDGRFVKPDVVGAGCLLIRRDVIDAIKATGLPLFFWSQGRRKEFIDTLNLPDPRLKTVSEDFWFCILAKSCGYDIILDTEVKCGHIGDFCLEDREFVPLHT